jgi:hypothetical protein
MESGALQKDSSASSGVVVLMMEMAVMVISQVMVNIHLLTSSTTLN